MAIEYKNKITLTKDSVIYGHQSVDDGGFPQNAGNAKVSEILDLAENQTKENLKGNVAFSVDSTNSRLYHLSLYGESVASFEVPDDKYLKSVGFDETTSKLEFTFVVEEKESIVYVDLSSLIRTYTAEDGLVLSNGKFSLVVKSGETHLKVGTDGVYLDLSDITKSIDGKAASDHNHDGRYYTKTEMDTKLSGKADSSHTHDDRYYTESEVDTKLGEKADSSHSHTVSQISDLTTAQIEKMNITTINATNYTGLFPVGAIYMSVDSTSPASLFGGKWSQLTDRFLIGAGSSYSVNSTGGASTVTLTTSQIPSHSHTKGTMNITGSVGGDFVLRDVNVTFSGAFSSYSIYGNVATGSQYYVSRTGFKFNAKDSWTGSTSSVGSGSSHNNMPPYLAVYMWKRIS